jgi:hypothetical protein
MTTDFPTAPPAYGLEGPSAGSTVEKSPSASHTEIQTLPNNPIRFLFGEYRRTGHQPVMAAQQNVLFGET